MKTPNSAIQSFIKYTNIVLVCFALGLIIAKHYSSVSFPYLQVADETHSYGITKLFYDGKNPYTLEYYPNYFNMYGIVYPYLSAQIAKPFGLSLVLLRIINVAVVIFILMLFYFTFKQEVRRKPLFSVLLLLILYNGEIWGWQSVARPDIMGTLFYCISILIPIKFNYNKFGLIISALFAILSFYTKIYFLCGSVFLFVWLLYSREYAKSIFYAVLTATIGIVSALLINAKFPLYFYETVFSGIGGTGSMTASLKKLFFFLVFISPIIVIIIGHIKNWNEIKQTKFNKNPYFFLSILSFTLLVYLGTWEGGSLNYHLSLLLPLLIASFMYNNTFTISYKNKNVYLFSIILLITVVTLQKPYLLKKTDTSEWINIDNYLKNKHNVLNSALVAGILIDQQKYIYEDGASSYGFAKLYKSKFITRKFFGKDTLIQSRISNYFTDIRTQGKNKKFDAIVIDKGSLKNYEIDTLYYKFIAEKKLYIPKSDFSFPIEIYEPR